MNDPEVPTQEIDPATVRGWIERGEAVLIDVREPDEHAREHIAGARLVPLSRFVPDAVPASNGTRLVIHCKSGRRAAEACGRLAAFGTPGALNMKGGIEGWKAAGLPVVRDLRVPISIMRQVQIVVGTAVLATSLLAAVISPWFLLLTGFFGAGLLFAGSTGTCALAAVLARMPWNRVFKTGSAHAASSRNCCGIEPGNQKE